MLVIWLTDGHVLILYFVPSLFLSVSITPVPGLSFPSWYTYSPCSSVNFTFALAFVAFLAFFSLFISLLSIFLSTSRAPNLYLRSIDFHSLSISYIYIVNESYYIVSLTNQHIIDVEWRINLTTTVLIPLTDNRQFICSFHGAFLFDKRIVCATCEIHVILYNEYNE